MQTVFTTQAEPTRMSFRRWREMLCEHFVLSEQTALADRPFEGTLETTSIGDLGISRITLDPARSELTDATVRRRSKDGSLMVLVLLEGGNGAVQDGRESVQRAGDLVLIDTSRPLVLTSVGVTSSFLIEVPRRRLEDALGPARLYSSVTLDGALGGAHLATTFFRDLVRLQGALDCATASRMASIGIDMLTAALAERLAREMPRTLHGDVVVHRAKAHIQANLGDPRLDPSQVAVAAGVSLRRLQELFQERDRNVTGWIWERRLDLASTSLADPTRMHMPIGSVAYACGFVSQAHFATRFKERFGLTPREFRMRALCPKAEAKGGSYLSTAE